MRTMSSANLDQQQLNHERKQCGPPAPASRSSVSAWRATKISLLALILAPIVANFAWLRSAFGPGSRLPDFWVRPSSSVKANDDAECWNVRGGAEFRFCEDIEHIPGSDGTVLISCDTNRAGWNTVMGPLKTPEPRGRLFTYDYPTSSRSGREVVAVPVELIDFPAERTFHPLGVSILPARDGEGDRQLFVINHGREQSSVEVFHLAPPTSSESIGWTARWIRSVIHPLATHTPNSIHALSDTSFIVTNDHLFARRPPPLTTHLIPLLRHRLGWKEPIVAQLAKVLRHRGVAAGLAQVETLLGLSLGWVSHVDFTAGKVDAKVVATGIPFANGIAVTPDSKTMVVAATTFPGVWMYDLPRDLASMIGGLSPHTRLHLPFRVDNLAWSHHNNPVLLATGHPSPFSLIAMSRSPLTRTAPSWVVAITPSSTHRPFNDDAPLSATDFALSSNTSFSIRSLLQTQGKPVKHRNSEIHLPSSASSFFSPHHHHHGSGTLLVSGLYGTVLTCTNVSI
ncbi:hypothetical protein PHSY_003922 [Pseudozyma hubeiensis SY62]|uniref:Uncharacterized protein n=1 Tax=Pseudozyma hubeiensis (strain SY62) TaxID=1305764 RepID=R9P559_PSEHS|nr:hypothetical protein PHSY_003922 [Pseudozyma hubeiensis SY62]GAC96342.1 hypothetical protein PHSY_003922 [Pseudozyma hubeiensis SY62]